MACGMVWCGALWSNLVVVAERVYRRRSLTWLYPAGVPEGAVDLEAPIGGAGDEGKKVTAHA